MAFKGYDKNPTFLDMEIQRAVSHPRNKEISKVRYRIEQYFGITHKYHGASKDDPRNPSWGVSGGKKSFPIAFVAD